MTRRMRRSAIAAVCAAMFTAACGSGGRVASRTPTTIGELSPPPPGEAAADRSPNMMPFDQYQIVLPCSQVAALPGVGHLFSLAHPPASAGRPVCYVEPINGTLTKPDGSPNLPDGTRAFSAGVWYIPDDLSVKAPTDSIRDGWHRGLFVEGRFGPGGPKDDDVATISNESPPPTTGGQSPEARLVYVNGHQVLVSRPDDHTVSVEMILHEPTGQRVDIGVIGNYTPDEMVAMAGDVIAGEPANERPPNFVPITTTTYAPIATTTTTTTTTTSTSPPSPTTTPAPATTSAP